MAWGSEKGNREMTNFNEENYINGLPVSFDNKEYSCSVDGAGDEIACNFDNALRSFLMNGGWPQKCYFSHAINGSSVSYRFSLEKSDKSECVFNPNDWSTWEVEEGGFDHFQKVFGKILKG